MPYTIAKQSVIKRTRGRRTCLVHKAVVVVEAKYKQEDQSGSVWIADTMCGCERGELVLRTSEVRAVRPEAGSDE